MRVKLLFFAALRDVAGQAERDLVLPAEVTTVAQLLDQVAKELPQVGSRMASVRIAVNEAFVDVGAQLVDGDTVALLPPVTGG